MTAFRTRPLRPDDESSLNEVYNRYTVHYRHFRPRSLDTMQWTWHNAPGGPVDSWVVEAREGREWRIVGHHGLCPVRFTYGDQDWLCAKVINSFLLPEFRDRFLYVRFEKECLDKAAPKYDATYSIGPGPSRWRNAFGYETVGKQVILQRGFQPLHVIYSVLRAAAGRCSLKLQAHLDRTLTAITAVPERKPPFELEEAVPEALSTSIFFRDFWDQARFDAGMAPRRNIADLEWRFWKNPAFIGKTLTYTWPDGGRAFCILNTRSPILYNLVDFAIFPADSHRLDSFLDALFAWCAKCESLALRFQTVLSEHSSPLLEVFLNRMKPFALERFMAHSELKRRFSSKSKARLGGAFPNWLCTDHLMLP